jgi:prepilin-type N-terminal cleavage/methylation domain-containing protein
MKIQPKKNRKIYKILRNTNGFTLLETVAVLIIVGIMAALGGIGIIQSLEAFTMSRENIVMNQQTQLAVNRITLELQRMDDVVSGSGSSLTFTSVSRPFGQTCTIQRASGQVTLQVGGNAPSILIENVTAATPLFTFLQADGSTAWSPASAESQLAEIKVDITVSRPKDILNVSDITFTTRVTPRNNGLPNGPDPDPIGS